MTVALATLIFGLSNGQQHGFTAPVTIAALVIALLLGAGFVRTEQTAAAPMLPLAIFLAPTRRAAVEAMLLIGAVLAGYDHRSFFDPICGEDHPYITRYARIASS